VLPLELLLIRVDSTLVTQGCQEGSREDARYVRYLGGHTYACEG
jgi:hypothetical protein